MVNPWEVIESGENYEIRRFENFHPDELLWHRDKEDRLVELIDGAVQIQFDNEMPYLLLVGEGILIPKMKYHRVHAKTPFTIRVNFYKGENNV